MATYKCRKCGIQKNDTVTSQLNTSVTCRVVEIDIDVAFHVWVMISEDDLICS